MIGSTINPHLRDNVIKRGDNLVLWPRDITQASILAERCEGYHGGWNCGNRLWLRLAQLSYSEKALFPMKLLVVCQHYKPEPFNSSEICEELVSRGYEVTVLTGLPNYPEGVVPEEYRHGKHRDEVVDGVRVLRVPIVARGHDLRGLNKARRIANYLSFPFMSWLTGAASRDRYDCVLCMQFSPIQMAYPALRIAKSQHIPCLIYIFDLWPEDLLTGGFNRGGKVYGVMRGVSKKIYGRADRLAVTSPKFEDYLRVELGLDVHGVEWLPQYAEEMFERMGDRSAATHADDVVFSFAGNVGGNQAATTIVRAASLVNNQNVHVRIAGSGSRLDECKALAGELGVRNLEFLGRLPLDAMPGLYASSDAMLLTLATPDNGSLVPVYTIPRKFQSYIASGKPVICAADGAVAEIVGQEGCGIVCGAEDAKALAEAMDRFAGMALGERSAMGQRAHELYQRQYSRSRFFERLEAILQDMAKGARTDQ